MADSCNWCLFATAMLVLTVGIRDADDHEERRAALALTKQSFDLDGNKKENDVDWPCNDRIKKELSKVETASDISVNTWGSLLESNKICLDNLEAKLKANEDQLHRLLESQSEVAEVCSDGFATADELQGHVKTACMKGFDNDKCQVEGTNFCGGVPDGSGNAGVALETMNQKIAKAQEGLTEVLDDKCLHIREFKKVCKAYVFDVNTEQEDGDNKDYMCERVCKKLTDVADQVILKKVLRSRLNLDDGQAELLQGTIEQQRVELAECQASRAKLEAMVKELGGLTQNFVATRVDAQLTRTNFKIANNRFRKMTRMSQRQNGKLLEATEDLGKKAAAAKDALAVVEKYQRKTKQTQEQEAAAVSEVERFRNKLSDADVVREKLKDLKITLVGELTAIIGQFEYAVRNPLRKRFKLTPSTAFAASFPPVNEDSEGVQVQDGANRLADLCKKSVDALANAPKETGEVTKICDYDWAHVGAKVNERIEHKQDLVLTKLSKLQNIITTNNLDESKTQNAHQPANLREATAILSRSESPFFTNYLIGWDAAATEKSDVLQPGELLDLFSEFATVLKDLQARSKAAEEKLEELSAALVEEMELLSQANADFEAAAKLEGAASELKAKMEKIRKRIQKQMGTKEAELNKLRDLMEEFNKQEAKLTLELENIKDEFA